MENIIEIDPSIAELVEANGGYCPCMVHKTPETLCPCQDFREMPEGVCLCGRYKKTNGY